MAAQSIRTAAICLLLLVASSTANAKDSAEWVDTARTAEPAQFSEKHVVLVDDSCVATIKKGDISITSETGTTVTSIELTAGVGVVIDFCAGDAERIFKVQNLFAGSAVWKVEGTAGYVEGEYLVECEAKGSRCCSMYFVPVTSGPFPAEIETCTGLFVDVFVNGDAEETLTLPAVVEEVEVDGEQVPVEVDISLVFSPECGVGVPTTEGEDGVFEGTGESSSGEGADGVYEGTGEGSSEGDDGVFEGTGESTAPPPEGDDGVFEGTGEGSEEGEDGVFEGTGESMAPPPEGDDGTEEGTGESQSPPPLPSRRLLQESENDGTAADYPGTKWFWSKGLTWNPNSLLDPSAAEIEGHVEESGEGSRRLLKTAASRSLLQEVTKGVPMFDAQSTPIELTVGRMYKLNINMVRAPKAMYFSAPDFFKACQVYHVKDANVVVEYSRLTRVEMNPGANYWAIEVVPLRAGDFEFTTSDNGVPGFTGKIKVLADGVMPSNSSTFATVGVSTLPCTTGDSPPAGEGAVSRGTRGALAALYSLAAGVVVAAFL